MGLFSKSCEYAMRAVFYIASQSQEGRRTGIKEIAEQINSPEHFLAKILQKLSKDNLILSYKGPTGGFYIDPVGLKRPLADVITSLEGESHFTGCAMGLSYCSEENPCPLHHEFKDIRNQMATMLRNTSIGEFNNDLLNGVVVLNK